MGGIFRCRTVGEKGERGGYLLAPPSRIGKMIDIEEPSNSTILWYDLSSKKRRKKEGGVVYGFIFADNKEGNIGGRRARP